MTEHQLVSYNVSQTSPLHSSIKAVRVKNFRVLSKQRRSFEQWKSLLTRQGLAINETEHFVFASHPETGVVTLIHSFTQQSVDNNVGYFLMKELRPFGLMTSENAFGAALVGVVSSIIPDNPVEAWNSYSLNTLRRLQNVLEHPSFVREEQDFISCFAHIYQRLLDLQIGTTLLDVGCACAFWPLLAAQTKHLEKILGVDVRSDAIHLSERLASLLKVQHTQFVLADICSSQFSELDRFDTVTAIHLLEHIQPSLLPTVMSNLLQATRHRLLIAVPYEDKPERAYGHEQVFNRATLEQWGQWCIRQMHGRGKAHCEDVYGGLLVIERD